MMHINPSLFLHKLIVRSHSNKIVYNETFHKGVNIIRGNNSSGKSTIANFIFYVLGGDFSSWTTEALKCKDVIAEVYINETVYTIKREIEQVSLRSMSIFWGSYEDSKNNSLKWKTFPYKQTSNQVSFSNILFNALDFPEVKNITESNITMHQILRLLYIDQDTPTQSLFRFERFDLPLTREAIAEILLGYYDDTLYNLRLELKQSSKKLDDKKREYDNLNKVFDESGNFRTISDVQKEIEKTTKRITAINENIIDVRNKAKIIASKRTELNIEKLQREYSEVKNNINNLKSKINQFQVEIADSSLFVSTLEKRISELNNSLLTKQILGELPLTNCPQCLGELKQNVAVNHCSLCKEPLIEEAERANAKRLLQEMELQVKESKSLLDDKNEMLLSLTSDLPVLLESGRNYQREIDLAVANNQSTRDELLDSLLIEKGNLEQKNEYLSIQIKSVEILEALKLEIIELTKNLLSIKLEIDDKEKLQTQRKQIAMSKIKDNTLFILKNDLERQAEFKRGKKVEIDFFKDSYSLDGSNNFSASSKILFKNAILFSIFFASLDLDFFRYPRFILCDNMEDKGMEKERTQNFQNIITKLSDNAKVDHQIIFTTSMVSDELNDTGYCVGKYYNISNKTLEI
ncbi:AAA family ATPase [Elizabethkingia anophelis]|uniref:AAA family ATPase n=1 Tax=Elizabethkingia anophelis TaxID=1117645 RepID=UPI000999F7A0|nr:AAA family ATPase [Elizabethkingia anophelis]OPC48971.1 hypothetical protein BAY05_03215 [Elizabethkingia anophelis]